jgi:hypothetical protein
MSDKIKVISLENLRKELSTKICVNCNREIKTQVWIRTKKGPAHDYNCVPPKAS